MSDRTVVVVASSGWPVPGYVSQVERIGGSDVLLLGPLVVVVVGDIGVVVVVVVAVLVGCSR